MRAVAVIPARYASTRFPGKPLALLLGRPMIAWVVEAALAAEGLDGVWVATDSEPIARAAEEAGARVVMTSPACASGTDRVAEAARTVRGDVYVNVQGDEPLVDPADIERLAGIFGEEPDTRMATLVRPADRAGDLTDPNVVKVVCDAAGTALYFSRSPIPYYRDAWGAAGTPGPAPARPVEPLRHLGLYAFRRDALLAFSALPPGRLEEAERLEQLRALEAGWRIRVLPARGDSLGVDRPEDLPLAERALRARLGPGRPGC
ncbi:MAG: 3-deoxy-manno-octulosonate cytidylyltransferase [Deferrisomatales bacterium]|nr:3-deoxy-manno-octulosonate cytidylyltransferase [Deferrisomatales bacterium]